MSAVCTHLGCTIPWNEKENKFVCPCHLGIFSADGKLLVYASDRGSKGDLNIWLQRLDSGETRQLTDDPGDEDEPDTASAPRTEPEPDPRLTTPYAGRPYAPPALRPRLSAPVNINETGKSDTPVTWRDHQPGSEEIEQVLRNLSWQTSLQFTRETRDTDVWFMVEEKP